MGSVNKSENHYMHLKVRCKLNEQKQVIDRLARKPAPTSLFDLLSVREAAYASRIHQDTIRRWIREGRLRAYGRRGTYRVNLKDLLPLIGGEPAEES